MKTLILLMLLSGAAFAAEPNPRLAEIAKERVELQKQVQTAQLLFENAQLKLEKLAQEEKELAKKQEPKK
jgi:hypothetical protein